MAHLSEDSMLLNTDCEPVEAWFKRRCEELGLSPIEAYGHIEELAIEYAVDQTVRQVARELGYSLAKNLAEKAEKEEKALYD
jgi:hypothetical protein